MQNTQKIEISDFAEYESALKSSELFKNLGTDLISEFISSSSIASYSKGERIITLDCPADWFYFVAKGWVKLYRDTMDGDEAIIDILGENEIFGEGVIFDEFINSFSASAVEEVVLIKLPVGMLANKLDEESELAVNLLRYTNSKNSIRNKEIEHHIVQNAPQKIGCFLLRLCDSHAKKQSLHLPFDKVLIASKLGMKPETFSRALTKLKDETDIIVSGRHFEVPSIQKLSQFCCGACSSQFPCSS